MSNSDEDIDYPDESSSIHSLLRSEPAIETRARSNARINQEAINAASPALAINLSTSSSAFATPPAPGIPVTTNTTSSASNSAATNGPTPVAIPTVQPMTVEKVIQLMRNLFSDQLRNNLSQPSTPAKNIPTASVKQVPVCNNNNCPVKAHRGHHNFQQLNFQ